MTARKKGVSIGAAMKQRMGAQEDGGLEESAQARPDPVPAISSTPTDDPLESFNTRLPRSVLRRLKVYAAVHDVKIQDALHVALDEYLARHGS